MEENLEIEFKILIDQDTYSKILDDHQIDRCYTQTNYYLIHPKLTELKYMLRIRQKNDYFELTLKQPQVHGNLETNLVIDETTKDMIINHQLVENEIFALLKPYQLDSTMFNTDYFLTTIRQEIDTNMGLVCLDYNEYNQLVDYELEYEVNDYLQGKQVFLDFIKPYQLNYQGNCLSKVKRVLHTIKETV